MGSAKLQSELWVPSRMNSNGQVAVAGILLHSDAPRLLAGPCSACCGARRACLLFNTWLSLSALLRLWPWAAWPYSVNVAFHVEYLSQTEALQIIALLPAGAVSSLCPAVARGAPAAAGPGKPAAGGSTAAAGPGKPAAGGRTAAAGARS